MELKTAAAGTVLAAMLLGGAGLAVHGSSAVHLAAAISKPQDPKCPTGSSTVTVDGFATAQVAPNEITISLGVQTQATKATVALKDNSTKANALIAKLMSDGVAQDHIQTSNLSIQPVYSGPKQVLTGYQVNDTLTVTLLNLSTAGGIIDDAAQIAGNSVVVNDISFSVQNDGTVLAEARAAAVRQAQAQAHAMASAAGMVLGTLCSLVDDTGQPQPNSVGAQAPLAAKASTPVEAGQESVSADVTAVYELETT
ncbi:MAG TPA: SIMPL domain-containing protein [Acidimicrobiales bacterium]|nr:SIMPL domain-containing protein [Acidimicrobiales bacterium]